jgi:hypothetical protein
MSDLETRYAAWRITFQSSRQAARSAFAELERLKKAPEYRGLAEKYSLALGAAAEWRLFYYDLKDETVKLLTDLLACGSWYPSALEIDTNDIDEYGDHWDGEELESRIKKLLRKISE